MADANASTVGTDETPLTGSSPLAGFAVVVDVAVDDVMRDPAVSLGSGPHAATAAVKANARIRLRGRAASTTAFSQ